VSKRNFRATKALWNLSNVAGFNKASSNNDSAATAGATREEFRYGDKQVDRQEEQIAHERKGITPNMVRKTAPNGKIPSY